MRKRVKLAPRYAKVQIPEAIALQIADLTQASDLAGNAIVSITEGHPGYAQRMTFGAALHLYGVLEKRGQHGRARLSKLLVSEFPRRDVASLYKHVHEELDVLDQNAPEHFRKKPLAVLLVDAMGMITTAIRAVLNSKDGDVEGAIGASLEGLAVALAGFSAGRDNKPLLLPHFVTPVANGIATETAELN